MKIGRISDSNGNGGVSALAVAWIALSAIFLGVIAWILVPAETGAPPAAPRPAEIAISAVLLPLPPALPPPEPAIEPAPEKAPKTPAPVAPAPVASAVTSAEVPPETPVPVAPAVVPAVVPAETPGPQPTAETAPQPAPQASPKIPPQIPLGAEMAAAPPVPAPPVPAPKAPPEPKPETAVAPPAPVLPAPALPAPALRTMPEPKPERAPESAAAKPAPAKAAKAARKATPPTPAKPPASKPATEPATEPETEIAALPPGGGLKPAPNPALVEPGRAGLLPKIGPKGQEAWRVYARPFDMADKRPRIAVIISNLGLSGAATETAIQQLPGAVTLAFSPYATNLEQWINLARAAGHEVLLNLPMEPVNYPLHDPGPHTLLTSLDATENISRLEWLLSRVTGYVGVTNHMGSRFTTSAEDLKPVFQDLKARGLMFVDSRASARSVATKVARQVGLPRAYNNRFIDRIASRAAIDSRLAEIEKIARSTGFAIAIGSAYPVTIERLARWLPTLARKKLVLAPVSALANKQRTRRKKKAKK